MPDDGAASDRTLRSGEQLDDVSQAFDILRSPRRRYALEYLRETDSDAVELDELAAHVLECERPGERPEYSENAVQSVYSDLYHAHVPRLSSAGLASYESSADAVRLEELPEPLRETLELARNFDREG